MNSWVNEFGGSSCLGWPLQRATLGQLCASLHADQGYAAFGTRSRALVLPAAAWAKASCVQQQLLLGKTVLTSLFTGRASEFTAAGLGPFTLFLISTHLFIQWQSQPLPHCLSSCCKRQCSLSVVIAWKTAHFSCRLDDHDSITLNNNFGSGFFASTNREDFWCYFNKNVLLCFSKKQKMILCFKQSELHQRFLCQFFLQTRQFTRLVICFVCYFIMSKILEIKKLQC